MTGLDSAGHELRQAGCDSILFQDHGRPARESGNTWADRLRLLDDFVDLACMAGWRPIPYLGGHPTRRNFRQIHKTGGV